MSGPLDDLLVVDFSRVLAAPMATMMLGDLGADVIKVEPAEGDVSRSWGPPFADGQAAYFLTANRNKRSLVLDLRAASGRHAALELARRADLLVENFRPATMTRLGLGWETLHELNPRLIYCSLTGFGTGPGATLPGYDMLLQAVGGLMSVTGEAGREPLKVGVAIVDVVAGLNLLAGALAAIRARDRTGLGQLVEVNLLSASLAGLVNQVSSYITAGVVPVAMGNRHPSITPYEPLRAADRAIVVAVGNEDQFRRLCAVLDLAGLADDPRFATNPARVTHREELCRLLEERLAERSAADLEVMLAAVSVPAGVVNTIAEAVALAERLELEPVVEVPGPGTAPARRQVTSPIRLSATPVEYRLPPPALGADTAEILAWLEGGSTENITEADAGRSSGG